MLFLAVGRKQISASFKLLDQSIRIIDALLQAQNGLGKERYLNSSIQRTAGRSVVRGCSHSRHRKAVVNTHARQGSRSRKGSVRAKRTEQPRIAGVSPRVIDKHWVKFNSLRRNGCRGSTVKACLVHQVSPRLFATFIPQITPRVLGNTSNAMTTSGLVVLLSTNERFHPRRSNGRRVHAFP